MSTLSIADFSALSAKYAATPTSLIAPLLPIGASSWANCKILKQFWEIPSGVSVAAVSYTHLTLPTTPYV